MPKCDLCGSKTEKLFLTNIEGASMNVCVDCSKLGNVIRELVQEKAESADYLPEYVENDYSPEVEEFIVPDFGRLVKNSRESKGMKQDVLAKKLAIKESLLHNIESGHFTPSLEMARKIGKFLHIGLIQEIENKEVKLNKSGDSAPLTFGDLIKNKLKK